MPISKQVEVCGYNDVFIENKDLVRDLDQKDAIEVIAGLLKKFPGLADIILKHSKEATKLYPKELKEGLMQKHKKENRSLMRF